MFESCQNPYGYLSVIFMVLFLLPFGKGMAGLPWIVNSEIYPIKYRSIAVSISTAFNWVMNLVVSSTFLSFSNRLTPHRAFWVYAIMSGLGVIWLYFKLPETKGKSLEEIHDAFAGRLLESKRILLVETHEFADRNGKQGYEMNSHTHLSATYIRDAEERIQEYQPRGMSMASDKSINRIIALLAFLPFSSFCGRSPNRQGKGHILASGGYRRYAEVFTKVSTEQIYSILFAGYVYVSLCRFFFLLSILICNIELRGATSVDFARLSCFVTGAW